MVPIQIALPRDPNAPSTTQYSMLAVAWDFGASLCSTDDFGGGCTN
jgi:hypothetical protein